MSEFEETILLAHRILDRANADPDDDLAMLSRQFLRILERSDTFGAELHRAKWLLSKIVDDWNCHQSGLMAYDWAKAASKLIGVPLEANIVTKEKEAT